MFVMALSCGMETFRHYLMREGLAENTVSSYAWTLDCFMQKYGEVTADNILRYKDYLVRQYRPQTVNLRLLAINKYLTFAGLPQMKSRLVRIGRKNFLENVISDADYRFFKKRLAADGLTNWYFTVWFLAATGARVSELLQIKAEHVAQGHLDIYSKGGKLRRLYIPRRLRVDAAAWLKQAGITSGYVFLNRFGERMTARGLAQQLKRLARRYGIDEAVVYPHSFRHLFARNFLDRRKDIAMLADLMGHENIETTRIYLRRTACEQKAQVDEIVDW